MAGSQKVGKAGLSKPFWEVRVNPDLFPTGITNSICGRVCTNPARIREKDMPDTFDQLCTILAEIDLFGTAGDPFPGGAAVKGAVEAGAALVPPTYKSTYIEPLEADLDRLLSLAERGDPTTAETLAAAVYQHAPNSANAAALNRFLAVISDLYRSFLDKDKRAGIGVLPTETLPPLAMFQHDGGNGPFTLPVDAVEQVLGSTVGVVSMPATYAANPVIWAALAHETGGHDVTHADAGLLNELGNKIAAAFAGMPNDPSISRDQLTLLWSYWIDEASADAYGLLNVGPAFAPNLAAFFAALNMRISGGRPSLRMQSGFPENDPNQILDPHPTDILRLHLAIGVIESLTGLAANTKSNYVRMIEDLAASLGNGNTVSIVGNIPTPDNQLTPFQVQVPLTVMQQAARNVGGFIATARLDTLKGHSIQDIETWDDSDEAIAQKIKAALAAGQPIVAMGDDAQVMAGATLALLDQPGRYNAVTDALNAALDQSFQTDPIWGVPAPDAAYIRYAKELTLRRR
jgi:hypothetical protein